uniref:Nudix hydrolase domain-containing protein n=1 Tax=Sinocyclocheilus anshuiensis TaxID=1608454 RepID=A0A671RS19_9TELE
MTNYFQMSFPSHLPSGVNIFSYRNIYCRKKLNIAGSVFFPYQTLIYQRNFDLSVHDPFTFITSQHVCFFCFFVVVPPGGSLKTTAEADSESLQAQWWDCESPLPLRAPDILPLIDAGMKYRRNPSFPMLQPVDFPCHVICQRLFLTFISSNGNTDTSDEHRLWLLLSSNDATPHPSLPIAVSVDTYNTIPWAAHRLIKECMPSSSIHVQTCGILGVQHNGRIPGKTDGICFNMLVLLENLEDGAEISSPPPLEGDAYRWHEVTNQSLRAKIIQRIKEGSVLPVQSL